MKSVVVTRSQSAMKVPWGNPFGLQSSLGMVVLPGKNKVVPTGLRVELPAGTEMGVESVVEGVTVVSHQQGRGDLVCLVFGVGSLPVRLEVGDVFARATITEVMVAPVRFMERTEGGHRMVRGEARDVETGA